MRRASGLARRGAAAGVLLAACALAPALACGATEPAAPAFHGTFLQPSGHHAGWDDERWRTLFADLERLGVRQIVVQWTVLDGRAFYPSERWEPLAAPLLERVLAQADAAGMAVWVGLAFDGRWWEQTAPGRDEHLLEVTLRRLELAHLAAAAELAPLVTAHGSFRGWYLPEEIDDRGWLESGRRELLRNHLSRTGSGLAELTPGAGLAISGFSNGFASPDALAGLWGELVGRTPLDRVLFQDGVGAHKLPVEEVPAVLGALEAGVEGAGGVLQVVIEVFEQVSGPPLDEGSFRAVPAPKGRVQRQVAAAAPFSRDGLVAFALPDYLSRAGGEEAAAALERWLR